MRYLKILVIAQAFLALSFGLAMAAKYHKLESHKVSKAPKVDGKDDDSAWSKAEEIVVEAVDGPEISIKSVYTDDTVYFLLKWEDETESINHNRWVHDGKKWTIKKEFRFEGEEAWEADSDRLAFQWVMNDSIEGFDKKGCRKICHAPEKEDKMFAKKPGQRTDVWYWISSVTNPLGYADDQYLSNDNVMKKDEADDRKRVHAAHYGDDGQSGFFDHQLNSDGDKPKWTHKKRKGAKFLIKGSHAPLSGAFKKGDTVPGYILERPKNSRGDINAKGIYKKDDYLWTLEISRKLITGDKKKDVQFDNTKKPYFFGLAIWDNDELSGHLRVKKPIKLEFE